MVCIAPEAVLWFGEDMRAVPLRNNKLAAADMHVIQTISTPSHPIGITYEPTQSRVWVACYSGSILVFDDS